MADIFDSETRTRVMAAIRGRNTQPEMKVRQYLHAQGYRFRLHAVKLPGRPDLVLARRRIAVFVHGCFWHRHRSCRFSTTPGTNVEFWKNKFEGNIRRDARNSARLRRLGWHVFVIWECQLNEQGLSRLARRIANTPEAKEISLCKTRSSPSRPPPES